MFDSQDVWAQDMADEFIRQHWAAAYVEVVLDLLSVMASVRSGRRDALVSEGWSHPVVGSPWLRFPISQPLSGWSEAWPPDALQQIELGSRVVEHRE